MYEESVLYSILNAICQQMALNPIGLDLVTLPLTRSGNCTSPSFPRHHCQSTGKENRSLCKNSFSPPISVKIMMLLGHAVVFVDPYP